MDWWEGRSFVDNMCKLYLKLKPVVDPLAKLLCAAASFVEVASAIFLALLSKYCTAEQRFHDYISDEFHSGS